jgi:hypothetical protein
MVCMKTQRTQPVAPSALREHTIALPSLLTKQDVAQYFHVSPRTVETWIATDKLTKPIKMGRHRYWTPQMLASLLGVDLIDVQAAP